MPFLQNTNGVSTGQYILEETLRKLSAKAPDQAKRAGQALDLLLEGLHHSPWQEVAWAFSRLTGDGFPVEFAFSSADEAIRYTTEVAGPELNEAERLNRAEQLLVRLGEDRLPEEVTRLFRKIQAFGPLRYGAWLGGRHSQEGDCYKLYLEVPKPGAAEANEVAQAFLGEKYLISYHVAHLCMIGYEASTSRIEFYFRVNGLESWEVGLLLRRAGLAAQEADFLSFLAEAYTYSARPVLRGSNFGFSYSIPLQAGPVVFTIFTFARSVFGRDDEIRQHLLKWGASRGWSLCGYAAVSESLSRRKSWQTYHGVVSFVLAPDLPPMLHLGLRPPVNHGRSLEP